MHSLQDFGHLSIGSFGLEIQFVKEEGGDTSNHPCTQDPRLSIERSLTTIALHVLAVLKVLGQSKFRSLICWCL